MQSDKLTRGIEIADLVDVHIPAAAATVGGEFMRVRGEDMASGRAVEDGFSAGATEDADGAIAATVIMDGAALARFPAQNQRVIRRTGAHEVSAVRIRGEANERQDRRPLDREMAQARFEQIQRDVVVVGVQFGQ